ncbi:quinone oxidoreductase-like [Diadema antillarum]|uniref:quinone oxidoreductase-like n=1 Tax=Diadema antillarum TaxID=105358 RepID=UPI003A84C6AD
MAGRTMRAVVIEELGSAQTMKVNPSAPVPLPGANQVLIKMKAVGINELDLRIRATGWRWYTPPFTLGIDGAGVIDSVGEGVTSLATGDRVYVFQPITGTYAEYCLADESRVFKLHDKLTFEEGAVMPNPYMCGIRALTRANFKKGETVLVQGASGGFGLAAVQLARGLGASKVVGSAGSEKGRKLVKEMGADVVLDYKSLTFKQQLRDTFGPKGVDVIIETNVDVNFELDMELAARMGRIVVLGKRGQTLCTPQNLVYKETTVMGCALFFCDAETRKRMNETIYRGVDEGWLKPYVGTKFKLEEVSDSHLHVENRRGASGKIILLVE